MNKEFNKVKDKRKKLIKDRNGHWIRKGDIVVCMSASVAWKGVAEKVEKGGIFDFLVAYAPMFDKETWVHSSEVVIWENPFKTMRRYLVDRNDIKDKADILSKFGEGGI